MELRMIALLTLFLGVMATPVYAADDFNWRDWWLTPEQQGQRAFERGEYAEAAALYRDPMHIGSSWYRAGDFKQAAAAFGRVNSLEAAFNQGNALVFQGQYAAAVEAYDRALAVRPNWPAAQQNRDIAQLRLERKQASGEKVGEATEIGADEVVFDLDKKQGENADEVSVASDQVMSDQELRALWLRKSQTSPAVFLKTKFAAQLALENQPGAQAEQ